MKYCKINKPDLSRCNKPAVLIDGPDDRLIKYGDYDRLQLQLEKKAKTYELIGDNPEQLRLVGLSALTVDEQLYIITRMLNFTATGFVKAFYEHLYNPNIIDWLHEEMARVPIYESED